MRVASAGWQPAAALDEHVVRQLDVRRLRAGADRPVGVDVDGLGGHDLVVAMARAHARQVVELRPDLWPRTFALKELVRRALQVGARDADESLEAWLGRLHEGRRSQDLLGDHPDDDVADPVGRGRRAAQRMASEIEHLVEELVPLAWPPAAVQGDLARPAGAAAATTGAGPPDPDRPPVGSDEPVVDSAAAHDPSSSSPDVLFACTADGASLGRALARYLRARGLGAEAVEVADAVAAARAASAAVGDGPARIAVCLDRSGLATSAVVNRDGQVLAATVHDVATAQTALEDLGARVLCVGARVVGADVARTIADVILDTLEHDGIGPARLLDHLRHGAPRSAHRGG